MEQLALFAYNKFVSLYNSKPLIVKSPGRINIIGEHTDYNDGFVLPAAIDKFIYIAINSNQDYKINLYSNDFDEHFSIELTNVKKTNSAWANYILGIVNELQVSNKIILGFNAVIYGDIPIGAGVSSSAALECAIIFALNEINNLELSKMQMAQLAQKAEHNFAGVNCGIMDMFASLMGKANHAIKLDCKSLDFDYIPVDLKGYSFVLFNTNVKHALASTEYNTRRKECNEGLKLIQNHLPNIQSLRDVSEPMLNQYVQSASDTIYKRCKYVVTENNRLQQACIYLQNNQLQQLGELMYQTHKGLSNDYEVSCKELDFLVDQTLQYPEILGARMMGGGFGGCTINLIKNEFISEAIKHISFNYEKQMNLPFSHHVFNIADGTQIVNF